MILPSLGIVTGQADDECQFKAGPSCSLNPAMPLPYFRKRNPRSARLQLYYCIGNTSCIPYSGTSHAVRWCPNLSTEQFNPRFLSQRVVQIEEVYLDLIRLVENHESHPTDIEQQPEVKISNRK